MIKDWMKYLQMEYKDNLWKIIRYEVVTAVIKSTGVLWSINIIIVNNS